MSAAKKKRSAAIDLGSDLMGAIQDMIEVHFSDRHACRDDENGTQMCHAVHEARRRLKKAQSLSAKKRSLKLFLYRVLENDDDGDPLDWGTLRAETQHEAEELLAEHFEGLGLEGPFTVRIYECTDRASSGVVESEKMAEHTFLPPSPAPVVENTDGVVLKMGRLNHPFWKQPH